jgi:hypothetical protein
LIEKRAGPMPKAKARRKAPAKSKLVAEQAGEEAAPLTPGAQPPALVATPPRAPPGSEPPRSARTAGSARRGGGALRGSPTGGALARAVRTARVR